jgi:hypothetical protein
MNKVEIHHKKKILSTSYVTSTKCAAFLTPAIQTTQYIKNKVINTVFGKNFELHPADAINKLWLNKYHIQSKASVASEFNKTFSG